MQPSRLESALDFMYPGYYMQTPRRSVNNMAACTRAFRRKLGGNSGFGRLFFITKGFGKVIKVSNVCSNACSRRRHVE